MRISSLLVFGVVVCTLAWPAQGQDIRTQLAQDGYGPASRPPTVFQYREFGGAPLTVDKRRTVRRYDRYGHGRYRHYRPFRHARYSGRRSRVVVGFGPVVRRNRVVILAGPRSHRFARHYGRHGRFARRGVGEVVVVRRYGPRYSGFGYLSEAGYAWRWIGLTPAMLDIANQMSERQLRAHEQALIDATTAQAGHAIRWRVGTASGHVDVNRLGEDDLGHPCREITQDIIVGGDRAWSTFTACQNENGAWTAFEPEPQ